MTPSEEYIKKHTHKDARVRSHEEIQKPLPEFSKCKIPADLLIEPKAILPFKEMILQNHNLLEERSKQIWKFIRQSK